MRLFVFLLFLSLQVSAQEIAVKKGMVMDSLKINDTLSESYSLYLPTRFTEQRNWPVIFVFDSEGRGRKAAQLFKPAAEQQGYIIVSSNNVFSNNDLEKNVEIGARLLSHVTSLLPVNYELVSVAGFSEGARVATAMPLLFNNLHGVIAVGNHYLNTRSFNKDNSFTFIGVVGDQQFTSYSMKTVAQTLGYLDFPSELYSFDGGMQWPNPEIISSAMATLTLQGMKEGLMPAEPGLVNTLYQQDMSRANRIISNNHYVEAAEFLELLEEKYRGLRDVSEIRDKQRQLNRSRNYREARAEAEKLAEREQLLIEDYIYYMEEDLATLNFENLGWWNFQRMEMDSLTRSEKRMEANMGRRVLGFVKELAKVKVQELKEANAGLEQLMLARMMQTIFDHTNYEAYKEIISLSALDGDYNTALWYLEEMLKHGYEDVDGLYNIEGTLGLKMTPQFNWLVDKYTGSARYYKDLDTGME